jgi:mRNA interferase ChpB
LKRIADRGEIWLLSLDPASGREQKGLRPVLILSPKAFNQFGLAFVAPITQGGSFPREAGFAVSLIGTGTRTQGVALVNQCTAMDLVARGAKFLEVASGPVVDDALARLHAILE